LESEVGVGGAINFQCTIRNSKEDDACSMELGKVRFEGNYASQKGGAYFWNYIRPVKSEDTVFEGNKVHHSLTDHVLNRLVSMVVTRQRLAICCCS